MSDEKDVKIAVLEERVAHLETEVEEMHANQEKIQGVLKTGKGVLIALLFLLGTGALSLGQGIARLLGIGD